MCFFKKIFLSVVFIVSICCLSCSKDPVIESNPHINICVLGNSYSNDSYCYVPFILKQYGITCCIHIYYRSGGSLRDLDSEWEGGNGSTRHFSIDTRRDNRWSVGPAVTAEQLLSIEQWDIISLQQVSLQAAKEESYSPYLDNIIGRIRQRDSDNEILAWLMAYNRADDDSNEENLRVQRKIIERQYFGLIFPVATSVFNCQANEKLATLGDSVYGKMYARDNIHLQEGLPCYAASLAIVEALLRKFKPSESVLGEKTRPTQKWIDSIGGITPNGMSIGVTEDNCLLAQKAAISANDSYFEILPIE